MQDRHLVIGTAARYRAGGIRTRDLLNPIQAFYQAELRPDSGIQPPLFALPTLALPSRSFGLRMKYRRLGKSGLQLSELSFGAWVTFAQQIDTKMAERLMTDRLRRGRQFFRQRRSLRGRQGRDR